MKITKLTLFPTNGKSVSYEDTRKILLDLKGFSNEFDIKLNLTTECGRNGKALWFEIITVGLTVDQLALLGLNARKWVSLDSIGGHEFDIEDSNDEEMKKVHSLYELGLETLKN